MKSAQKDMYRYWLANLAAAEGALVNRVSSTEMLQAKNRKQRCC
jgi:hypothetical protein